MYEKERPMDVYAIHRSGLTQFLSQIVLIIHLQRYEKHSFARYSLPEKSEIKTMLSNYANINILFVFLYFQPYGRKWELAEC